MLFRLECSNKAYQAEPNCFTPFARRMPAAQQTRICGFISEPPHGREPLIDRSCSQAKRFEVKSKSENNGPLQCKARFRAVPGNELLDGELVVPSGVRGTEAVEDRGFRVIQIRQPKNLRQVVPALLAHACRFQTADMHKVEQSLGSRARSTSASAMMRSLIYGYSFRNAREGSTRAAR